MQSHNIRQAFSDAVDAYEGWSNGEPEPSIEVGSADNVLPISRVAGMAWHSKDSMPRLLCDQINGLLRHPIECREGSSYAQGARHLKAMIESAR